MSQIIDGKQIAHDVRAEIAAEVKEMKVKPSLAVILVGDDNASHIYVRNKHKACEEVGIESKIYNLPENTSEEELLNIIDTLNADPVIDGILVQLPLPEHISEHKVIEHISPEKDVDAFHEINVGKIMIGNYDFLPCTPAGIMELLERSGISVEGKNCVVVGRSNIVGKPMAMLFLHANGTVTICHSKTKNLSEITKSADILVSAVGKGKCITSDMVSSGTVVIDVGMNRNENGKLCGDVDFEEVSKKASYITPVPGGVGPMTITMLLKNTVKSAKKRGK